MAAVADIGRAPVKSQYAFECLVIDVSAHKHELKSLILAQIERWRHA
jgi:hypothetical protein